MLNVFANRPVVSFFALFVATGVSSANSASDAAANWGLLGTWRIDCGAAPSMKDLTLGWIIRDGKLYHERDWGAGKDSPEATTASVMPDGGLVLTVGFDGGKRTRQFELIKRDNNHIQTVWNKNISPEEYLIRDGKFTDGGGDAPVQTRCQ